MYQLIVLRHGESEWNRDHRFTGWTDVALTDYGRKQAKAAGELLRARGFVFDEVHENMLHRTTETTDIVLQELEQQPERHSTWRLNERHYGALQGHTHTEMAQETSVDQVQKWRRSYSVRPPLLDGDDERHPAHDVLYEDVSRDDLPSGECLADTCERVMPYWHDELAPAIKNGKNILIVASHNSLRALAKEIKELSDEEVVHYEIPTGTPVIYTLDDELKVVNEERLKNPYPKRKVGTCAVCDTVAKRAATKEQ